MNRAERRLKTETIAKNRLKLKQKVHRSFYIKFRNWLEGKSTGSKWADRSFEQYTRNYKRSYLEPGFYKKRKVAVNCHCSICNDFIRTKYDKRMLAKSKLDYLDMLDELY